MFIRRAFTIFVALWSTANRPLDWPSAGPSDWIVDWRWFEEADDAAEMSHAAGRHCDLCVTTSLQVNAPS